MKKVLAVLLAVCVMCAGAAFAQPRMPMHGPEFPPHEGPLEEFHHPMHCRCLGHEGHERPEGPQGHEGVGPRHDRRVRFAPNMPQEIRDKVVELEKLKIDLDEALTSKPLNKAKAIEVHAKMQTVRNDIAAWRFERKLERLEKKAKSKPLPHSESEKGESESEVSIAQ